MDYIVVSVPGPVQLATDVLWWMNKGYTPQGGVSAVVIPSSNTIYYMQAMIKEV
jgi:hypothetical protein